MKNILLVLIVLFFTSCKSCKYKERKMEVNASSPFGYTIIRCDSIDMISIKEAIVYIDGRPTRIIATEYILVNVH